MIGSSELAGGANVEDVVGLSYAPKSALIWLANVNNEPFSLLIMLPKSNGSNKFWNQLAIPVKKLNPASTKSLL